jgi:hypothetical protein
MGNPQINNETRKPQIINNGTIVTVITLLILTYLIYENKLQYMIALILVKKLN